MRMPWNPLLWMAALGFALAACDADDDCVCDDDDLTAGDDDSSPTDDVDGDGFTAAEGDCDDNDAAVHPAADEGCGDGVDSDCDGVEDSGCRLEIEAGDVEVGSNETSEVVPGQFISYWDERPQHTVALSAFAIELYEVTNFQYRRCRAGFVREPDPPQLLRGSAVRRLSGHQHHLAAGHRLLHLARRAAPHRGPVGDGSQGSIARQPPGALG